MFHIVIISSLLFATTLGKTEAPYPAESPIITHYSPPAQHQFAPSLSSFASSSVFNHYPPRAHVPAQSYQIQHYPGQYFQGQSAPSVPSYPVVAGGLFHAHAPAYNPAPRSERVFPGFVSPLTESGFAPPVPRTNYGLPSLRK